MGGAKPGHSEGRPGWWGGGNQRKDLPKKVELTFKGKTTASCVVPPLALLVLLEKEVLEGCSAPL